MIEYEEENRPNIEEMLQKIHEYRIFKCESTKQDDEKKSGNQ